MNEPNLSPLNMLPPSIPSLILGGLFVDLLGALVLASPDLPGLKQRISPERVEEARSHLMDIGYLSEGDQRYWDILPILHKNVEWLDDDPYRLVIDHYPARGTEALYIVYEEDGLGPYDELDDTDVLEAQERDSFDWVGDKSVVYGWIGDEIVRAERLSRLIRGIGAFGVAGGFALQIFAYLL